MDLELAFWTKNFFGLAAFIDLYLAGRPDADLADPAGVFNFFDVAAFAGLSTAGCP